MQKTNSLILSNIFKEAAKCIVTSGAVALIAYCLLCCAAKVLCIADLSEKWLMPVTTSLTTAAVLLGISLLSRRIPNYQLLHAIAGALILWSVLVILGLSGGQRIGEPAYLKAFIFLCAASVGYFAGNYSKEKRKKYRRLR